MFTNNLSTLKRIFFKSPMSEKKLKPFNGKKVNGKLTKQCDAIKYTILQALLEKKMRNRKISVYPVL